MALNHFVDTHCRQNVTVLVLRLCDGAYQCPGSNISNDLAFLCFDAEDLAQPILDYESAARESVFWAKGVDGIWQRYDLFKARDAKHACQHDNIQPISRTPTEFYAVSHQLAEWLIAEGERVRPLAGMMVWASIGVDPVLKKIWKEHQ